MTMDTPAPSNAATGSPGAARSRPKSREIRIGLVMYGGVALAVYINGVSREFFNAVRGRGVYRLLKAMTDSDVVVDVVSGTSAGGINGILLGYALCNEREFADCADLWREHGDIARLVRDPAGSGQPTVSLLDSEGYYQPKLAGAFSGMQPCAHRADEDVSNTQELDLFVTGTEVEGRRYTVLDDSGHAVDVKDHRTVFLLKHRTGRRHPFDPAANSKAAAASEREAITHGALAKLGRITSCFPVAFAPVKVEHVPPDTAVGAVSVERRIDALLTEWGSLRRDSCFLDGGVLDNKPFTSTAREIFRRTAERKVERRLFYVEPDPEQFKDVDDVAVPNVAQAAMLAMVGIPGYESIADDLKLLAERNSKIRTYKRLAESLEQVGRGPGGSPPSATAGVIYRRSRLVALSQRVVRGLLRINGEDQLLEPVSRERAELLFREFDRVAERAGLADELLHEFDVYYRLRRLFDLIDYCYNDGGNDPLWSEILWKLNRQIKLLDIVRNAMEQLLDVVAFDWRNQQPEEVWRDVGCALSRLLSVTPDDGPIPEGYGSTLDDDVVRGLLGEVNRRLLARIEVIRAEAAHGSLAPPPAHATRLLQDADEYERQMIEGFRILPEAWDDTPIERYRRFQQLDERLYPLEMFGEVNEKDEIRTVRVSPIDAQRGFSRREGTTKTAGQTLFHFGGFFRRSWRSNDILCGRLDAVAQILEEFFDRDRLAAVASGPLLAASLRARFGGDLDPATLFPNAGRAAQDTLRTWLAGLVDRAGEAYARDRFDQNLTLLVEMAQLEILHDDLHKLLADETLECREWLEPDEQRYRPFGAVVEAEQQAAQQLAAAVPPSGAPPVGPRATPIGQLFSGRGAAAVGQSVLKSVPPMVLLETMARLMLVARDALVTTFGDRADAVRKSATFKWIDRALRLFHGSVVFYRRATPQAMAAMAALALAALVALVVGIAWWGDIVAPEGKPFNLRWFIVFLLLPAAILSMQAVWLTGVTWLRRRLSVLAVVVAASAVGLVVWQRDAVGERVAAWLVRAAEWFRALG